MRTERESFAILDRALGAAGTEADASFLSVDQNISRFANSNIHQNMSEISAGLTLRVIVDGSMGVVVDELIRRRRDSPHRGAGAGGRAPLQPAAELHGAQSRQRAASGRSDFRR
ncbi:MAG TPA: hypothetical protein VGJ82_18140, partial [Thermoanaerobaculia bacterium]